MRWALSRLGLAPCRASLRVTSSAGEAAPLHFDAVLIEGRIRGDTEPRLVTGASVPFALELAPGDLVAVFRQRPGGAGTMRVEYTLQRRGEQRAYARVQQALVVLVRRGGRMKSGGIAAPDAEHRDP